VGLLVAVPVVFAAGVLVEVRVESRARVSERALVSQFAE
jgi:hypothetical protein